MKKISLMAFLAASVLFSSLWFAFPASSATLARGEKAFGPFLGFASKNESAVAGINFQYAFTNFFRISPRMGYVFRSQNKDAFALDCNAQFPFAFSTRQAALYPIGGVVFRSWNLHSPSLGDKLFDASEDVSTRKNKFGLDFGAGFELRCTSTFKFSVEAAYFLVKDFSGWEITAGVYYIF